MKHITKQFKCPYCNVIVILSGSIDIIPYEEECPECKKIFMVYMVSSIKGIETCKIIKETNNLCEKCPPDLKGRCCFFEIHLQGKRLVTEDCCSFLDIETMTCKVYKCRHQMNDGCLTFDQMYDIGTLPKRCPYVMDDNDYQARKNTRLYDYQLDIKKGKHIKGEKLEFIISCKECDYHYPRSRKNLFTIDKCVDCGNFLFVSKIGE